MVKPDPNVGLLGLGALLAFGLFVWARVEAPVEAAKPAAENRGAPARPVSDVVRVGLDRIDKPAPRTAAGRRDVFAFGEAPRAASPVRRDSAPPPTYLPPPSVSMAPLPMAPVVPPLNVKFIGALNRKGAGTPDVAILMTDRREILTAQAGEVVANRLRVVRIGVESIDVQDVGGGAVRRLPLRAN